MTKSDKNSNIIALHEKKYLLIFYIIFNEIRVLVANYSEKTGPIFYRGSVMRF